MREEASGQRENGSQLAMLGETARSFIAALPPTYNHPPAIDATFVFLENRNKT